jgi:diguanylate cyclase (GGDEF)-like protein
MVADAATDQRVPASAAETANDVLEDDAHQNLMRLAFFDELTGLPNKAVVDRSVRELIRAGEAPFALVLINIDRFRNLNDYFGHELGDDLIVKLAQRLSGRLCDTDLLGRLNSDEFILLLSPSGDPDDLTKVIDQLSDRIKEPFFVEGQEILTSASLGVSRFPNDGADFGGLLTNAQRAMRRAKATARGSVSYHDVAIADADAAQSRLEQRLRLAIRDRRVRVAFQPKVDLHTGEVGGAEVLMRWYDEDGIIRPPGRFLELAADLGLMDDLTRFILAESIQSIDRFNEAFGAASPISVNIAANQAGNAAFMQSIVDELDASGFAHRFILEITEEAFLAKRAFQTTIVPMIRKVGARVSIDDFGTGYSSLSALAEIAVDELKVDRSFITGIHNRPRAQAVLRSIELLGRDLDIAVVVEGIESEEELTYLRDHSQVRYGQGFYFAKAMHLPEMRLAEASQHVGRAPVMGRMAPAARS